MSLQIPVKLLTDPHSGRSAQSEFINIIKRHSCFSGGYGNGKSYAASLKALLLLTTFPRYRVAICRRSATDLRRSTMSTFFKVCPSELYDQKNGGNRADSLNYCKLINGAEIFWLHLEDADENIVRGLEVNSVIIDQAEEISENMYNHLSARVGRWDEAKVPDWMIFSNPDWPTNPATGKYEVPAYMMVLCNPDSELHWIYRRYHPESLEWRENFQPDYEMVQASSTENPTLSADVLKDMMSNDPVWVQRFVYGKWGIPGGAIHELDSSSVLEVGKNCELSFVRNLILSGNLYRVLDHGDSSPTSCIWFSAYKQWFFAFREYYRPGALISDHRKEIDRLSRFENGEKESYRNNWADPQIFKLTSQKFGGFWSTADEYKDQRIDGPPLVLNPADNNELSTRNRLNEYFRLSDGITHPITGTSPAPRFYFIKRSEIWPNGCYQTILETKSQKRKQEGTVNGKPIFSDDRDESVSDHAYDCVRYFAAMHPFWTSATRSVTPQGSFFNVRNNYKMLKKEGKLEEIFGNVPVRALGSY